MTPTLSQWLMSDAPTSRRQAILGNAWRGFRAVLGNPNGKQTLIEFSGKYVDLYERVTGQAFEKPDPSVSVRDRIHQALARELPEYF